MAVLTGTVYHAMDAKNRIRIPAKFRTGLGKEYSFIIGSQGCIAVYPQEVMDERVEKLNDIHSGDPKLLAAKRKILSSIEQLQEDEQGRTLLPASFRQAAGIKKEVVTIGMGNYIEIWAKEVYDKANEELSMDEALALVDF